MTLSHRARACSERNSRKLTHGGADKITAAM